MVTASINGSKVGSAHINATHGSASLGSPYADTMFDDFTGLDRLLSSGSQRAPAMRAAMLGGAARRNIRRSDRVEGAAGNGGGRGEIEARE